jgi:hypothetical protein
MILKQELVIQILALQKFISKALQIQILLSNKLQLINILLVQSLITLFFVKFVTHK